MSTNRQALNLPELREKANRDGFNEAVQTLADAGKCPHYAPSGALVSTADATDLGTSKTLAAALALAVVAHGADTNIHSAADVIAQAAAWASAPAVPADLTEVQNVLNELKGDINTHAANATPHRNKWGAMGGDGVVVAYAITTADATTQGTANALANAIKAFLNNHSKAGISTIEVIPS